MGLLIYAGGIVHCCIEVAGTVSGARPGSDLIEMSQIKTMLREMNDILVNPKPEPSSTKALIIPMTSPTNADCLEIVSKTCSSLDTSMSVADPRSADCPLVFVNRAFENLTGYARQECLGRNSRFLQGPTTDRIEVEAFSNDLSGFGRASMCVYNYRRDRSRFANLVFVENIDCSGWPPILVGCQFPFWNLTTDDHALLYNRSSDQIMDDMGTMKRSALLMGQEAFRMRADSIFMLIRSRLAVFATKEGATLVR